VLAGQALAAPRFHLLLCGRPGDWDARQLSVLRSRHPGMVAVDHLTREAAPGALQDVDGHALARLGVKQTAHYLIRPDGHIAYRAAGTDLQGLQRHLAHWPPNATPHPA
jgi:hypothetical protein